MSAALRFCASRKLDLGICKLEKAANTADPPVLEIVDVFLGALKDGVGDFGFLLNPG